jgi:signal transduction histidine kinase/ActR/RegA family two-component response regulator
LGHDYLLENDVGSEIVTVPEWESVLPALADGKADCAVMGLVQGMRLRQEEGYRNVRVLPQPLLQRSYCIAVEEGNRELLAILNEGLNLLKTSGEYDAIYEKWFSVYESASSLNHPLVRALAGGVLVLAIVLISIALWTRSLRRQVRRRTTDLRVTMEQLAQANETKDRFLAGVSHELRTPLHGITGMVQLMDKTNLDTRQSTLVDNMRTASDQLHRVISDLIDISRLDSGKLSLKETSFSLGEVITWIEPVLSKEAQSKGLDLRISTDGDANTPIVTDKERIAQIILNLADNAIKNTDAGGVTIRLTLEHHASEENDVLIIRVHDTGRGISEDDQQSVFTAFTQLETAPGKLAPGLGLGLSIVKSITDLLNGSIEVSSTRGGGSTFTVRLPVLRRQTDHQTGGPSVTERNEAVPSSKQVLIAEDEAINRLYLEQLLSGHGWNTTTASDGEDVMKKFTEGAYDVVFMDLSMPKLGGLEATRRIRDIEARIGGAPTPIIALTAHAREDDRQECLSAGMNGFVTKPFNESSLFREIKRVLEPRP